MDWGSKLRLRDDLVFASLDRGGLVLGEALRRMVSPVHAAVLGRADGSMTADELSYACSADASEVEVAFALQQLWSEGILVDSDTLAKAPLRALRAMGRSPSEIEAYARGAEVRVVHLGSREAEEALLQALEVFEIRTSAHAGVLLVSTEDYGRPELQALHLDARRDGLRSCTVCLSGVEPWFGPMLDPSGGPCWECLAHRLRHNRPVEQFMKRQLGRDVLAPRVSLAAFVAAAATWAAAALARALFELSAPRAAAPDLHTTLWSFSWVNQGVRSHRVTRRPQCSICGDERWMQLAGSSPLRLESVRRRGVDGGFRRVGAQSTYELTRHHVSPITGVVAYLEPMAPRHSEQRPVFAAGYRVCPQIIGANTRGAFDKVCAGKGRTAEQARMSALAEALERYAGVFQGDEASVRACSDELGDAALTPDSLMNFSDSQYRADDGAIEAYDARSWRPVRLDRKLAIDWTPGWSISREAVRYVPLTYCYAEAPYESGAAFASPCGNGVAAGTCMEEAVLQGLLELVERDAVAVWWYNRIARPAVAARVAEDSYLKTQAEEYAELGWRTWILDLTHDLGIPVCAALAYDPRAERYAMGFGCHLSARLAAQRAATELNQVFDLNGPPPSWQPPPSNASFLQPNLGTTPGSITVQVDEEAGDLKQDIGLCLDRIHAAGLECVVVDKSRPDIELSVAQVIVPGLRHFWPRLGPGRLYSVPVSLGWTPQSNQESSLNPLPLFL